MDEQARIDYIKVKTKILLLNKLLGDEISTFIKTNN